MKLTVVAPPECQVVLSGCTIMFQGNFESSPSFLFSFTIQMLVQSDLLKYWFAENSSISKRPRVHSLWRFRQLPQH